MPAYDPSKTDPLVLRSLDAWRRMVAFCAGGDAVLESAIWRLVWWEYADTAHPLECDEWRALLAQHSDYWSLAVPVDTAALARAAQRLGLRPHVIKRVRDAAAMEREG